MRLPYQDALKHQLEALLDCRIYRYSLPRGADFAKDVRPWLGFRGRHVIFDVGANVGQSVGRFRQWFPAAQIISFEPVATTYKILYANCGEMINVDIHCLALGSEVGEQWIYANADPLSSTHSFVHESDVGAKEKVSQTTLDRFCEDRQVDFIDVLKIDVEGYERSVLHGAERMLSEGRVKFLFIETTLRDEESWFVPFAELDSILRPYRFDVFAIYDQESDVKRRRDSLYFCNAAWIARDLARRDRQ